MSVRNAHIVCFSCIGMKGFLLLLLPFLVMACRPSVPSDILSESEMEDILYDYHLGQSIAEVKGENLDQARYLNAQAVFQKHGITEAEFDSSMVWYSANSGMLEKIYMRLNARFEAESKGLGVGISDTEMYASMAQIGDTANVWSGSRILFLEHNTLNNVATLIMPADSNFLPGDKFKLSFSAQFLGEGRREAYVFMNVLYKDSVSCGVYQRLSTSYDVFLDIPERKDRTDYVADRIVITFYYPAEEGQSDASFFYVVNPALLRIHDKTVKQPDNKDATLSSDSLRVDSLSVDSVGKDTALHPRLTPEEMRNNKQVEHSIRIVKERPVVIPRRTGNRRQPHPRR